MSTGDVARGWALYVEHVAVTNMPPSSSSPLATWCSSARNLWSSVFNPILSWKDQKYSSLSMRPQLLTSSDPSPGTFQSLGLSWKRSSLSWPQPMSSSGRTPLRLHMNRLEDFCCLSSYFIRPELQVIPFFVCVYLGARGRIWAQNLVAPQLRVVTLTPSIC